MRDTAATATRMVEIPSMGKNIEIEYQWIAPELTDQPIVVFLHEGLGSVSMWRDWPSKVCTAIGCRGLIYSRYGYGQSTPRPLDEKRDIDYLHVQAHEALPLLLNALGLADEQPILYGHSDGGSIALLYAALFPQNVGAIAVAAPHIFVEDITIAGICEAKKIYETTDFPARLGRHHRDGQSVFRAWTDVWLTPAFRDWNIEAFLNDIRCPVLAIQGVDDEYGTLEQIRGIKRRVPHTELLELPACGHSPHRDQPQVVIGALQKFIEKLSIRKPPQPAPDGH